MDAYILWCRLPYPTLGSTRELRVTRAYLGVADEHIQVVTAYLRTGLFRPSSADVLAELRDIIARAGALCTEYSGDDLEAAREIHAYATLLAILYRKFLEMDESGLDRGETGS